MNLLTPHMQNSGTGNIMEVDNVKVRRYMQDKIYEFLVKRQPTNEPKRVLEVVRRVDEILFKKAMTMDDYINLETLESRILVLLKHRTPYNNYQQFVQLYNSSSAMNTMIPTPGMFHTGNSTLMPSSDTSLLGMSGCNSMEPSLNVSTGNLMATGNMHPSMNIHGGHFSSSDGTHTTGYQLPSNFGISSGNKVMPSLGASRIHSQMIPTPGYNNNNNNNSINNNINSQSYMNLEASNNGVGFSGMGSVLSQLQQQKMLIGGQNSHMFHNISGQMGSGMRADLQQTANVLPNGTINGRLGMIQSNLPPYRGSGTTDGYITSAECNNSNKSFHQNISQHQQSVLHGDGFGISSDSSSGPGNIFAPATSVGLMMNVQNMNSCNTNSTPQANSQLITAQLNMQKSQQEGNQSHSIDMSEKMNYASSKESFLNQNRQFQQQSQQQLQLSKYFTDHSLNQKPKFSPNNVGFGRVNHMATDSGYLVKPENVSDCNQVFQSCGTEQFQPPECQFQQNSSEIQDGGIQIMPVASSRSDSCSPFPQTSQSMRQLLHSHQLIADSQNMFLNISTGALDCRSQDLPFPHAGLPTKQHTQEEFNPCVPGRDETQRNNLSSDGSLISQSATRKGVAEPLVSTRTTCRPVTVMSKLDQDFRNQQKWLLFLHHARRCSAPEGKCQEPHCIFVQRLLKHIDACQLHHCTYPRCCGTKKLIEHFRFCHDAGCPVCVNVRIVLMKIRTRLNSEPAFPNSATGPSKSYNTGETPMIQTSNRGSSVVEISSDIPPMKKIKSEQNFQPVISEDDVSVSSHPVNTESHGLNSLLFQDYTESHISNSLNFHDYGHSDPYGTIKSDSIAIKDELPIIPEPVIPYIDETKNNFENIYNQRSDDNHYIFHNPGILKPECSNVEKDLNRENSNVLADHAGITKSGKPKIKGVSLTELFTPEQIKDHILSLRQWVGQSRAKAEKNQQLENSMSENSCQLCAVEKLTFEPPPIYCSLCGSRIKRNAMFYTVGTGDTRHYFCIPCYNESRGDALVVDGTSVMKSQIEKKKNDEETEEWWVQCDKCEAWQHQICALFNGRRNDGGEAEYTCPNCYIEEINNGERVPLPQSTVLGAKDLPKTILSDHIEQRLFRRLKQERLERAKHQGKSFDEVPGAESLVVRVVSSVDKKLDVRQRFLEIFEENYPTEYLYKSKVILLFQKIEGVEVCLFGMYVQEFGSECEFPNQRRVYLSYLDSVKYFRPEIKAVTGEALRTFVYHEILIGYLEYCKRRGFTSCYIWACPPLKGEDYILYCHPEIQKTPKSDKLREWYLSMLRKAAKENIVVDLTNLYDHFFVSTGECKAKVTAARLPYFDGDYWPGAAEEMILSIRQEEDGRKFNRKGTTKKTTFTKRALKASGQLDLSGNASRDFRLMHKLGETISPMKEDFIMVHLQHACTHCCNLLVAGGLWVCSQCKNFKLCERCYDVEQLREERERHPVNQREKHILYCVEITDVPCDTKDEDDMLESEFFDTRQAFLSLCQGNHYQYDTLRRAKHSSMMVLYHLHNPTAPAFVTTCNICHLDIETGQGWRCETCPDYDLCTNCYTRNGGVDHPHKLTNHPSMAETDVQNKEARQIRVLQLRHMLDLLIHASQCHSSQCQYQHCRKVKGLFRHGFQCKQRLAGGCLVCKRMWYLLQLHSRSCKDSACSVPRCKDLRKHVRRLQQQADSRRRAAVMEMMRQRTAEVAAGNSG